MQLSDIAIMSMNLWYAGCFVGHSPGHSYLPGPCTAASTWVALSGRHRRTLPTMQNRTLERTLQDLSINNKYNCHITWFIRIVPDPKQSRATINGLFVEADLPI